MVCYCGGDIDDCEMDGTMEQDMCSHCTDRDDDDEPTETMKLHQERVVTEKNELDEKRTKLAAFLDGETYRGLDAAEQKRLRRQADAMLSYSTILQERLAALAP
jgi:hypothetical protein